MSFIAPISVDTDPFLIRGPAVISFSGGRSSAYMLWRILQAHGGALPDDVVVCFANTGREMPATLDFVRDCGAAWNAPIVWLEYRRDPQTGKPWTETVSHNSASRNGEPLAALLAAKPALPNPLQRSCTIEAKIRTIKRFLVTERGWKRWTSVVGLRFDEPNRVIRALDREKTKKDRWHNACPLAQAKITKADVLSFWASQPFDLQLAGPWEGNCDGCFLKSRASVMRMMRDYPERMEWWAQQEAVRRGRPGRGRQFRKDRETYAELADLVARTPLLPFDETMHELGESCDGGCGI